MILQILFTCKCDPSKSDLQVEAIQKDIWSRCAERNIGGFFLRSGDYLVGLFEGQDSVVIGKVEYLIRKHKVSSVYVVREAVLETRDWTKWNSDVFSLEDLSEFERKKFEGLAQIVGIAVEANQRSSHAR